MFAASILRNGLTDLAKNFCLLRLGQDVVLGQKKVRIRDFYLYTFNIVWQKSFNLLFKNAGTI